MDKIFAVYKPSGMTSYDVVARVKKLLPRGTKVGHAGTLDPLAEGVLVIAVGSATKRISEEVAKEKEYVAVVRLGEESTTDDDEGEKTARVVEAQPSIDAIKEVLKSFTGTIQQVPPVYSALKVRGKPAYERVRSGEEVKLAARPVIVRSIDVLEYAWPLLKLRLATGPGVYIRAIARDVGSALGVGGYLAHLTRTRVGEFTADVAVSLERIGDVIY